jgi:nitroreductase
MRSVGMAAQTLMLAAQGMGYDSGPMIGFDQDAVAKIIKLPADHVIGMFVVIGKKMEDARPRSGRLSVENVLIENSF